MKDIPLLCVVGLIILCLPLFLPYFMYDFVEYHNYNLLDAMLGKSYRIVEPDLTLYGSDTPLSYFPLIWMLFPVANILRKNQYRQRLFLVIHSAVVFALIIALFFLLTAEPSFYKGYSNVRPSFGFYSSLIGTLLLLIGAIQLFRSNPGKDNKKKPNTESDLLDSSI